jgi:hypothetical protein
MKMKEVAALEESEDRSIIQCFQPSWDHFQLVAAVEESEDRDRSFSASSLRWIIFQAAMHVSWTTKAVKSAGQIFGLTRTI